jgi:hypothetical protein
MSFEGYFQILCKNGHKSSPDCYENPHFGEPATDEFGTKHPWTCHCGATASWWNLVDETNGSFCSDCNTEGKDNVEGCKWCDKGRIDGYVELEAEKLRGRCVCGECGDVHLTTPPTYRVPENCKRGHVV